MTQPILIKVYGNLCPGTPELLETLSALCLTALPEAGTVSLEDSLLLISFEGIWFPLENVIEAISAWPDLSGKVDYLDIENWRLERYLFENGHASYKSGSLNQVLEYSGH